MKVETENSGIVELQAFKDPPDGDLFIGEALKNIPFEIRRLYFINNLGNRDAIRGKHAHKQLEQAIFCINGSFTLYLDDGFNKQKVILDNPSIGILMKPLLWHEMTNFSKDCVILVLANDFYEEVDYIRDYETFIETVKKIRFVPDPK